MKRIEKIWNESDVYFETKGSAVCDMMRSCEDCKFCETCRKAETKEDVKARYKGLIEWADEELDADPAAVPASDYAIQRIDELNAENKKLRAMFWTMVSLRYDAKRESLDNLIQFSLFTDPDKFEKIMAERDRFVRYSARAKSKAKEAIK